MVEMDRESFAQNGYAILENILNSEAIHALKASLKPFSNKKTKSAGRRNLFTSVDQVRSLATTETITYLAKLIVDSDCHAVKATYFDKNPDTNWKVPPHQDITITVLEKREVSGFGPWTFKDGIHNVQPPDDILNRIVAFRFHLDDCYSDNGALKVWPGSHKFGKLKDHGIAEWISRNDPVTCEVPAGGLLIMSPLLIHASSKAVRPDHRRVVHIEYAGCELSGGLDWDIKIPV